MEEGGETMKYKWALGEYLSSGCCKIIEKCSQHVVPKPAASG